MNMQMRRAGLVVLWSVLATTASCNRIEWARPPEAATAELGPPQTFVLDVYGQDTYLDQTLPNTTYRVATTLTAREGVGAEARTVLRVDPSAVSSWGVGRLILSARLELYVPGMRYGTFSIYRSSTAWGEGMAPQGPTWNCIEDANTLDTFSVCTAGLGPWPVPPYVTPALSTFGSGEAQAG